MFTVLMNNGEEGLPPLSFGMANVAVGLTVLLVAWIAWAIYVTRSNGATAGSRCFNATLVGSAAWSP